VRRLGRGVVLRGGGKGGGGGVGVVAAAAAAAAVSVAVARPRRKMGLPVLSRDAMAAERRNAGWDGDGSTRNG